MYRLAHLSDPHVPPDARPRRRELLSKRAIGWTNWRRSRQRIHRRDVLDMVTADLAVADTDHIAVTGDLTIVSSRAEWRACREWLAELGEPAEVSLVPGNHDAYTRRAVPGTAKAWREYMSGDNATPEAAGSQFPYLRRRGPLALIGCSSAVATAPFLATGRLGRGQRERIEALLRDLAAEDVFRIVLIHHPPLRDRDDRYRRLTDGRDFAFVLSRVGAELVIHGHDHASSVRWTAGPEHAIPVVGVPSASALAHAGKPAAGYNVYEIGQDSGGWACRMSVRGFDGEVINPLFTRTLWRNGNTLPEAFIER